jgi:hypothetical protein
MNESALTRKIVKDLNTVPGVWAVKIHGGPHQVAGIPDILGCAWGLFFGFEVKKPGRERMLTDIQALTLKKIAAAGGLSALITSISDAREYLDELRQETLS